MMNKLKNLSVLILLVSISASVHAANIPGVGVNWKGSVMQVEFKPENSLVQPSSCFAAITPTPCTAIGPYEQCVGGDLDSLGYSDTNTGPTINNCFHEAGDYRVTIRLVDFANNHSPDVVSNFTVQAGNPDPTESELIRAGTGCETDQTAPIANNDDSCLMKLIIRDKYKNPVTQLSGGNIKVYTDSLFPMDANNPNKDGALSFIQGLRVNSPTTTLATAAPGNSFPIQNDAVSGIYKDFLFYSITPTMTKVGTVLATNEIPFQLDLVFTLPGIAMDGTIDLAHPVVFHYGKYSPDIRFRPMITDNLDLPGNLEFIIDVLTRMDVSFHESLSGNITKASNLGIKVTHHFLPWTLKFDPTFFINDSPINILNYTGTSPIQKLVAVVVRGATADYTENLSFSSVIGYNFGSGGPKVSYPGNAIGAGFGTVCEPSAGCNPTGISVKLIGASIEGEILGGAKTTKLGTGTEKSFLVGSNKFTDIREDIFKNAYRITRSLKPKTPSGSNPAVIFNSAWYTPTKNVVVVEGDVEVNSVTQLPSGRNTLVIKNGNLILSEDLTYGNNEDSFGFILINDAVQPFPEKGNLLIKNVVQKIAGTFFLEGGIMTNDDADPSIYGTKNALISNDRQLLWEGAVLSHSTLGGGYESLYATANPDYVTPWGLVSVLDAENNSGYEAWINKGKTNLKIAQAYDLHMVRYYKPEYDTSGATPVQTNGNKCVCQKGQTCGINNSTFCDKNDNAFVIRIDSRMSQLPPPGFETVTTIRW